MSDIDDFRTELTENLIDELHAHEGVFGATPWRVRHVVNALTERWSVHKDMHHFRDATGRIQDGMAGLLSDPGPEDQHVPLAVFKIHIVRDQTAEEIATAEAILNQVTALADWKYGKKPYKTAPPPEVSILDLLEQKRWWVTREKKALRIKDMDWDHRHNVLRILRGKGLQLHLAYCSSSIWHDAPEEVLNGLAAMDPHAWLEERPLVKKLVKSLGLDDGMN